MADKNFIMALAKMVVAAAWADGHIANEEINALKDLLFNLEGLTGDDWAQLEIYIDTPVTSQEREKLLGEVVGRIKSAEDKNFVVETLQQLFEADGVITEEETSVLEQIKEAVSGVGTSVLSRLSKILKGTINRRDKAYKAATQRESQIDDYIKNTIYYQLKSEREKKPITIDLDEQKVRQLCLAAGLLARIAFVDKEISEKEKQTIKDVLSTQWGLSEQQAGIVAEISCERTLRGLDYFRLSRGFFECTDIEGRKNFLKCLFKIANAAGKTSHDETEEIRKIAGSLKLSHRDFIEAKLTIPDQEREVL